MTSSAIRSQPDESGRIVVSYSEIDTLRQCPHKHELGYRQRWTRPTTSAALQKGTLWHQVMETYYKALQDPAVPQSAAVIEAGHVLGASTVDDEYKDLIQWMFEGHLEFYGDERITQGWTIVAVEHEMLLPLPTANGRASRFWIKSKLDLVVKDQQKRLWILDHKSGKDLPKRKDLDMSEQFPIYTWGLRKMNRNVFGSIYSAARTQKNKDQSRNFQPLDERFQRTLLTHGPDELFTMAREAQISVSKAYGRGWRPERFPNPDTCGWKCDFTEACLMGRKQGDEREVQFLRDIGFVQDFTRH